MRLISLAVGPAALLLGLAAGVAATASDVVMAASTLPASGPIPLPTPIPAPLAAEKLSIEVLPARSPHWVYVFDEAFFNETDMRVDLYDGDRHRLLGQIDAGYYAGVAVSPDHKTMAVATTYWSRGGHGTRSEVLEFTDTATLAITNELVLPPKRAQGPPTLYNLQFSRDQHLIYSTNLTPAASISVIDFDKRAVLSEIDSDGCVLAIPSLERRVTSICENGRLLSIIVDDNGKEVSRSLSAKFFDADKDPVFVQAVPSATGVVFLSFHGAVHAVDLSGPEPKFAPSWSLAVPAKPRISVNGITAATGTTWRPGGTQMGAVHTSLSRLYVTMHEGVDGSHKSGGTEIFVHDLNSHSLLARWKIDTAKYGTAIAVQVSQDAKPLLFVATEHSFLLTLDALSGRFLHAEPKMGQSPWYLLNP